MAPQKIGIADVPVEVLIDNILPFCEVKDVFSLGCTNKFFALITTDDTFWKRRLAVDYNFTGSETARSSGWKFIYKRLRNPRVFVWGYVILFYFFIPSHYEDVHSLAYTRSPDYGHSGRRTREGLDCLTSRRRRFRMFHFQSNFTFQVSAWSAWRRAECQYRFRS